MLHRSSLGRSRLSAALDGSLVGLKERRGSTLDWRICTRRFGSADYSAVVDLLKKFVCKHYSVYLKMQRVRRHESHDEALDFQCDSLL